MSEHLRSSGELRPSAKSGEISAPRDLLDYAKTCKKTLRVGVPDCFRLQNLDG